MSVPSSPDQQTQVPAPLIERCLEVLRAAPAGLICDVDGTISQIAATPEAAVVTDDIRASLSRLARHLAVVGIVSGRSAPVAATMVNLPELVYIGNHGMERLHQSEIWQNPEAAAFPALAADWLLIENKGVSATMHYRLAPDPTAAQVMLLPVVAAAAARHGLIVTEGRLIFEFRPNVAINKGTALADLVDRHQLRGLLFLGDDLTDVDGFLTLQRLRAAGAIAGLAIGVLGVESHPLVRETMDIGIPGVPAAAALLHALSEQIGPVAASPGSRP